MSPLQSMTGFGRADKSSETGGFVMEIKSVNHRFLDSRIYLPREMSSLEIPLSKILKKRLSRGKVDVSVQWTPGEDFLPRIKFDKDLLKHYQTEIVNLAQPLSYDDHVAFEYLLSMPGVSVKKTPDLDLGPVLDLATETLVEALDALVAERAREGQALLQDLTERLDTLEKNRAAIEERRQEVVEAFRARLKKKAKEWAASASIQIDEGRLETEILLFAERSDVSEELTRLAVHISAFRKALDADDGKPQGKPLEFLTQELLRETNTVASKARDTDILSCVLEMKNEIEKVREQVMNVE